MVMIRLRRLLGGLIILSLCFGAVYFVPGIVNAADNYYVDGTNGNDQTGDGSFSDPWETIQKAADTADAGDTVYIRAGTYRETVTPANSGTSGNPITFKPYNDETVTISGTDEVTGSWTQHDGDIYKTTVEMDMGSKNQVFIDGDMMYLARWPNNTGSLFNDNAFAKNDDTSHDNQIYDSDMQDIDWEGGTAVVWVKWFTWTGDVTDYSNKRVWIEKMRKIISDIMEQAGEPKPIIRECK
jgi:hypothetical protein